MSAAATQTSAALFVVWLGGSGGCRVQQLPQRKGSRAGLPTLLASLTLPSQPSSQAAHPPARTKRSCPRNPLPPAVLHGRADHRRGPLETPFPTGAPAPCLPSNRLAGIRRSHARLVGRPNIDRQRLPALHMSIQIRRANCTPLRPSTSLDSMGQWHENGNTFTPQSGPQHRLTIRTSSSSPPSGESIVRQSRLVTKGPWTQQEDAHLVDLVEEIGEQRWVVIASRLRTRSGKQARERWHNHLNPVLRKGPFSLEEEEKIEFFYSQLGSKWAEIAKHVPGRSDNAIKNYFNTSMTRRFRKNASISKTPTRHVMQRSISYQPYSLHSSAQKAQSSLDFTPPSISSRSIYTQHTPPKTPSPHSTLSTLTSSPLSESVVTPGICHAIRLPPPIWDASPPTYLQRRDLAPIMSRRTYSEPIPQTDTRMSLASILC